MSILLLSRYDRRGASSRLRTLQYVPFLEGAGVSVSIAPLLNENYLVGMYQGKRSVLNIAHCYRERIRTIVRARRYKLLWIEKELFPWVPDWIERQILPPDVKVLVDYDDAIFHRYDQHKSAFVRVIFGKKISSVMNRASVVVVGNEYLRNHAKQAGARRIEFIPTVVDLSRYSYTARPRLNDQVTIGWIGTPSTARYLDLIVPALRRLCLQNDVKLLTIGGASVSIVGLDCENRAWSEETEVRDLQDIDIGIMPLPDEPFERGKCGYKLIQYMACGKPVVASPVGANIRIVRDGLNGFLAASPEEWYTKLNALVLSPALRCRMGQFGRRIVEEEYSLCATAPRVVSLVSSLIS